MRNAAHGLPGGQCGFQQPVFAPFQRAVIVIKCAEEFLVSLGELSAVGNLMGRLIGGNMVIQGLIARVMYASLYKLHQISIYGYLRVGLDTIGRFLRRRLEPRVKLH